MRSMERLRKPVAALLTAALGTIALAACESPINADAWPHDCYQPTASELHTVEDLFNQPSLRDTPPYNQPGYLDTERSIAAKYGLTIADQALQIKIAEVKARHASFTEMFDLYRHYLAEYGLDLSVAKPDELSPGMAQVPTAAELASDFGKHSAGNLLVGFPALPVEYVKFTGTKRVVLAAHTGYEAYALAGDDQDTIVVDINNHRIDPWLSSHELGHHLDARECGSKQNIYQDPGYASIAGSDIYGSGKASAVTHQSQAIWKLRDERDEAVRKGDKTLACQEQRQFDALLKRVVAFDADDGLRNVAEDKATLYGVLAFPWSMADELDTHTPMLRRKFLYLMARLEHFNPDLVRYFAAASTRPSAYSYDRRDLNCAA